MMMRMIPHRSCCGLLLRLRPWLVDLGRHGSPLRWSRLHWYPFVGLVAAAFGASVVASFAAVAFVDVGAVAVAGVRAVSSAAAVAAQTVVVPSAEQGANCHGYYPCCCRHSQVMLCFRCFRLHYHFHSHC